MTGSSEIFWLSARGDVDIFGSVAAAESYVEPADVDDDDYIADASGATYTARPSGRTIRLEPTGHRDEFELRRRLEALLVPTDPDAARPDRSLLLESVIERYGLSA